MRNSPGRKQRRQLARSDKKRGDLNRTSTHEMYSKMGMKKVEVHREEVKVAQHRSIIDRLKSVLNVIFRRKREVPND
jgi:regulator of sirC expression with transglutaminase-like and TPR domain